MLRVRSVVIPMLATAGAVAAQPAEAPAPEPDPPPPPATPPVVVQAPPGTTLPTITITITNNNNGNNSNTVTQSNPQTTTQADPITVTIPPAPVAAIRDAPAAIAPVGVATRAERPRPQRPHAPSWLVVGASERSPRASLDVWHSGHLSLGVEVALDGEHGGHRHHHERDEPEERDGGERGSWSVGAYAAYTTRVGPLDVRAQLGAISHVERRHGEGEAALLVGLPVTRHLGVVAGPIASSDGRDRVEVAGFVGVRLTR